MFLEPYLLLAALLNCSLHAWIIAELWRGTPFARQLVTRAGRCDVAKGDTKTSTFIAPLRSCKLAYAWVAGWHHFFR